MHPAALHPARAVGLAAPAFLLQGAEAAPAGRSPVAWVLAGLLVIGALYLLIRLLELDHANKTTPNQEDPLAPGAGGTRGGEARPDHQGKT